MQVGSASVVAKNNILGVSILVWDEETGKSSTVGYEACVDARRRDCVLSKDAWITRFLSQSYKAERREGKKREDHVDQWFTLQYKRSE